MTNSLPAVSDINGKPCVSSLDIAKHFEKRHDDVLKKIRDLISSLPDPEWGLRNFAETPYTDPQNGQIYTAFSLTRDGFTLLAMSFTGAKALGWKLKYIEAFNAMENHIATSNKALQSDMAALKKELSTLKKELSAGKKKALPDPGPSYVEKCAKATQTMLTLQNDVYKASSLIAEVFRIPFQPHIGEADYMAPDKGTPREKFACSMNYAILDYMMTISKSASAARLLFNAYVEGERLLPG